jgi:hypothetical protein
VAKRSDSDSDERAAMPPLDAGAVRALFALLSATPDPALQPPSFYYRNASTQICTRLHFAPAATAHPVGARIFRTRHSDRMRAPLTCPSPSPVMQ